MKKMQGITKPPLGLQVGLIYPAASAVIEVLNRLSLVEFFKYVSCKIFHATNENARTAANVGIDIFIVLKFLLVLILWLSGSNGPIWAGVISYLLFYNVFTYFYYHVWSVGGSLPPKDIHRLRHRFINLILAVSFSVIAFAYLYATYLAVGFEWSMSGALGSLAYSFSNAFFAGGDIAKPTLASTKLVILAQQFNSFVFITIILANSIPAIEAVKGEE